MELVATLLVAGVVLLLLETVLPGLVAGMAGACCLLAGVIVAYAKFDFQTGTWVLTGVIIGCGVGTALWLKYFPGSPMARPFISKTQVGNIGAERPELLHQTGTALTALRPAGVALINGQRIDVVTNGEMIERDRPVQVMHIEGARVVVRAAA